MSMDPNKAPLNAENQDSQPTGWESVAAMADNPPTFSPKSESIPEKNTSSIAIDIEKIIGLTLPEMALDEYNPETPQLSQLKTARSYSPPFLRQEAKKLQSSITHGHEMDSSEMETLAQYFENSKISPEEKSDMVQYIGEDFKEFTFERFFDIFSQDIINKEKQENEYFNLTYDDPMECKVPYRINGVPAPGGVQVSLSEV